MQQKLFCETNEGYINFLAISTHKYIIENDNLGKKGYAFLRV